MTPTKPGWKTTEFWLSAATSTAAILAASAGVLPPKDAAIAMAVSTGIYTMTRGAVKATTGDGAPAGPADSPRGGGAPTPPETNHRAE